MQYNEGIKTFTAGTGGVYKNTLVKYSSSTVVDNTATSTDMPIGVALADASDTEQVAVRLINYPGTVEIVAAGAISAGVLVYAAADGEIQAEPSANGTYRCIGIAMEAATTDQDIIEVLPYGYTDTTTVSS